MSGPAVLIVEDEILIAFGLQRHLERLGARVVGIADTADRAVAEARSKSPDLVIMDIMLKGQRSGIDAAVDIRGFSDVPIVYTTGNAHLERDPALIATKCQGVYSKPPSDCQILDMLSKARTAAAR